VSCSVALGCDENAVYIGARNSQDPALEVRVASLEREELAESKAGLRSHHRHIVPEWLCVVGEKTLALFR
jgi:hypothetical protein